MGGMHTTVARWLAVTNGTPSEVIGALEEVPLCCVTDLGVYVGAGVCGVTCAILRVPFLANGLEPSRADHIGALATL